MAIALSRENIRGAGDRNPLHNLFAIVEAGEDFQSTKEIKGD